MSNLTPGSSTSSCPRIQDNNFPSPQPEEPSALTLLPEKALTTPAKRHLARAKLPNPPPFCQAVPPALPQPFLTLPESPSAHRCYRSPGTTGQAGRGWQRMRDESQR